MYKITVKGKAKTDYPHLSELDGIDCQDEFTEYFDSDFTFKHNVTSGYLRFEYDKIKDELYSVTTYTSDRELSTKELDELLDYTSGQWSDGIGEEFEQHPCYYAPKPYHNYSQEDMDKYDDCDNDSLEVFISPWSYGQSITIKQELIK